MDAYMEKLDFVLGSADILKNIGKQRPYGIFATPTVDFLDSLSVELRRSGQTRRFPDISAFAFWCRRASVLEMGKNYAAGRIGTDSAGCNDYARRDCAKKDGIAEKCRVGRGVSLHFVSSNIPVLFGFSMVAALLAGDCVLVRLPSKRTPQEDVIVAALCAVMEKLPVWRERIVLFRSPHDRDVTDALSALCDVRVIWGGDRAVREIRQSLLPARALELPFADRRSAAVFSADAVLEAEDLTALVRSFYNDTYRNDQNACSSPHLLFWLGDDAAVKQAKERFWSAVEQSIESSAVSNHAGNIGLEYEVQPAIAVKKWEQALYLAATSNVRIERRGNLAIIIEPEELSPGLWEETVPGGFFFQSSGMDVTPLLPALSRKVQTLTCFGVDRRALAVRLAAAGVTGVDRIVDVGHALDFSLVWDGMDLIGLMSREIAV